jgi:hypothetical protein
VKMKTVIMALGLLAASTSVLAAAETGAVDLPDAAGTTAVDLDPKFEIRINNDAASLTQKLIPNLIWPTLSVGLGSYQVATGFLPDLGPITLAFSQCHVTPRGNMWYVSFNNIVITPAVTPTSVALHFAKGKKIEINLDLPDLALGFELEFVAPHDDNFYCNSVGSQYRSVTTVRIVGLTGAMTAAVDASVGGKVGIASVTGLDVTLGTISTSPSFLAYILDRNVTLHAIFGKDCGTTLNACVDYKLKKYFASGEAIDLKVKIRDALTTVLQKLPAIEGAANLGNARVDYAVSLQEVTTADTKARLRTVWDVDFSSNTPNGPCAIGLTRKTSWFPVNNRLTASDMDVLIPYAKIEELLYRVAKTDSLCAPFLWNGQTVQVKPVGHFTVTPQLLNQVKLSIPVQITVVAPTGGSTGTYITAILELFFLIQPNCANITLTATNVNFANVNGTISYTSSSGTTYILPATAFINSSKRPTELNILAALQPPLVLTPGTFGLTGLGHYLSYGPIYWGTSEVTFGVEILSGACP